jgi:hypothetical protein
MPKSFVYLSHAKHSLEGEMAERQRELVHIVKDQSPNAIARREQLEEEIQGRKLALEKLETQTCCDRCRNRVSDPETLRIRITNYETALANTLTVGKAAVFAECEDCCRPATAHEIQRAIEELPDSDRRKLEKCAYATARYFPPNLGKTGEDLLQEAFYRTWAGRKKWKLTAVDFPGHVRFAIRNIGHDWQQQFYRGQFAVENDNVTYNAEGEEISLTENAASLQPSIEQNLIASEKINHLLAIFKNNKAASAVLDAFLKGAATTRDLIEDTGLTKRQVEGACKRIRLQSTTLICRAGSC